MAEVIQRNQSEVCEGMMIGSCRLLKSCPLPDYAQREVFQADPSTQRLFNIVSKSIISNLGVRCLETIDRDPLKIATANLPNFSCARSSLTSFSRDELGTFYAKACVETIGSVVKKVQKTPTLATREELQIFESIRQMSRHSMISENGGINAAEIKDLIEWYFSGDDSERAPKGTEKYINLEEVKILEEKHPPKKRLYFSSHRYDKKNTPEEFEVSERQKRIVALAAKGWERKEIAQEINLSVQHLMSDIGHLLKRNQFKSTQQLVFQSIYEGELDVLEVVNKDVMSALDRLDPEEIEAIEALTRFPFNVATTVDLASQLGVSEAKINKLLYSAYSKVGVSSRIVVGVAYLAYKQSKVDEAMPALTR